MKRVARNENVDNEPEPPQQRGVLVHRRDDLVKVEFVLEVLRRLQFRALTSSPKA